MRIQGAEAGSRVIVSGICAGVAAALAVGGLPAPVAGAPVQPRQAAPGPARPAQCDDPVLGSPRHGVEAVRSLGPRLASAAARAGTTGPELAEHLRADRTLWVDQCGALYYADSVPEAPEGALELEPTPWQTSVPLADAFSLHSRPGAARVILLDFDGHLVNGSGWNSLYSQSTIQAPAFSTDEDPDFSDAERSAVIEVWQRVAQDFAVFDVDVTTADPGEAAITRAGPDDQQFGTRVLITPDPTQVQCGCSGRAYLGVFDRTSDHAYYQPAWVYPDVLSNNAKYIAEAASHEAGHTLNLRHDGTDTQPYYTGSSGWGPIMGSPYGQAVTQWSRGDYPDANNTEDDLALIAEAGAPLLPDVVPDDAASALSVGAPVSVSGRVNAAGDVDAFRIQTTGGTLQLVAEPAWPGPNLDVSLALSDDSGQVIASSAPVFSLLGVRSSLRATIDAVLPAGTYVVSVGGTGNGHPGSAGASDYGSVGWYTLSVVEDNLPSPSPTASPSPTPSPSASPTPTPTASPSASPTPTPSPTTPSPTVSSSPTASPTPTPPPTVSPSPTASPSPSPTKTNRGKGGGSYPPKGPGKPKK